MSEMMRLTYTYDGDTLGAWRTVNDQQEQVKLRLAFIDAPEIAQGIWGIRARSYLRTLLYVNESIAVNFHGYDKYGRLIAEVLRRAITATSACGWSSAAMPPSGCAPSTQPAYHAAQAIAKAKTRRHLGQPGPPPNPLVIPMTPPLPR